MREKIQWVEIPPTPFRSMSEHLKKKLRRVGVLLKVRDRYNPKGVRVLLVGNLNTLTGVCDDCCEDRDVVGYNLSEVPALFDSLHLKIET